MKLNPIINKNLKALILSLIILFGAGYAIADYTEPGCTPTVCNTDAPIDITTTSQAKLGRLAIGTNDISTLSQYVMSVANGLGYVQGVVTPKFALYDGSETNGYALSAVDNTGLAKWKSLATTGTGAKMYVDDFNLYVKREAGTVSVKIPSSYQYCAIYQLGPDFANADQKVTSCSVNQNTDKSWTLQGERADDPEFWCNARCFAMDKAPDVPIVTAKPILKQYYCNNKQTALIQDSRRPKATTDNTTMWFGCALTQTFDPRGSTYSSDLSETTWYGGSISSSQLPTFYTETRKTFANDACGGSGNWKLTPDGADPTLPNTGFACY